MSQLTLPPSAPADGDLRRRVASFLASRYLPALRSLDIEAQGGIVTLRGRVSTFYEKQVAISSCRRVAGVLRLIDAVDVQSPVRKSA